MQFLRSKPSWQLGRCLFIVFGLCLPAQGAKEKPKKKEPTAQAQSCQKSLENQAVEKPGSIRDLPVEVGDARSYEQVFAAAKTLEEAIGAKEITRYPAVFTEYLNASCAFLKSPKSQVTEFLATVPGTQAPADFLADVLRATLLASTNREREADHLKNKELYQRVDGYGRWLERLIEQAVKLEDTVRRIQPAPQAEVLDGFARAVTQVVHLFLEWHGVNFTYGVRDTNAFGLAHSLHCPVTEILPRESRPTERLKRVLNIAAQVRHFGERQTHLIYSSEYTLRGNVSSELTDVSAYLMPTRLIAKGESLFPSDLFNLVQLHGSEALRASRHVQEGSISSGDMIADFASILALARTPLALTAHVIEAAKGPEVQLNPQVYKAYQAFANKILEDWKWNRFEALFSRVAHEIGAATELEPSSLSLQPHAEPGSRILDWSVGGRRVRMVLASKENKILVSILLSGDTKMDLWLNDSSGHAEIYRLARGVLESEPLDSARITEDDDPYIYLGVIALMNEAYTQVRRLQNLRQFVNEVHLWFAFFSLPPEDTRRRGDYVAAAAELTLRLTQILAGPPRRYADLKGPVRNLLELSHLVDERARRLVETTPRRGAEDFRERVLKAYGGKCAITASDVGELLQASHIVNYWGDKTNVISNGILLRQDLHTLWDRQMISIDPETNRVIFSEFLKKKIESSNSSLDKSLLGYEGKALTLPSRATSRPNADALKFRHTAFLVSEHVRKEGRLPAASSALGEQLRDALTSNPDLFIVITYSPQVRALLEAKLKEST